VIKVGRPEDLRRHQHRAEDPRLTPDPSRVVSGGRFWERGLSRVKNGGLIPMIGFIVAGLVIGALARLFKPGKQNLGLLATLLLGLAGSVIGGVVANLLGTGDIFELNVLGFIVAVVAAVLLIGVAEGLAGRRKRAA
jgi:uncharacterized membrane protein YeaQ/YmgE (transglycosylase-associated protein family)